MLVERVFWPLWLLFGISMEGSMLRGLREAIAIGAVRAIEVGVVMAYEARLDANPCPGTEIMCCAGDQQVLTAVGSGSVV